MRSTWPWVEAGIKDGAEMAGYKGPAVGKPRIPSLPQGFLPDRQGTIGPRKGKKGGDKHPDEVAPPEDSGPKDQAEGQAHDHEDGPEEMEDHEEIGRINHPLPPGDAGTRKTV